MYTDMPKANKHRSLGQILDAATQRLDRIHAHASSIPHFPLPSLFPIFCFIAKSHRVSPPFPVQLGASTTLYRSCHRHVIPNHLQQ